MRIPKSLLLIPAALIAAACGRNNSSDDALKNDLALASQAQPATPQLVSPTEATPAAAPTHVASAPVAHHSTHTVYRSRRPSSGGYQPTSSTGGYNPGPSTGVYNPSPAPAPAPVIEKHGTRDAAIGAGAGAVIGAATSRDKIKGGIIGAAAGAILGGVVGNTVDVTKRPQGW